MITQFTGKNDFAGIVLDEGEVMLINWFKKGLTYLFDETLPEEMIDFVIKVDPAKCGWGQGNREIEFKYYIPIEGGKLMPPKDDFELNWLSSMIELTSASKIGGVVLIDPQGIPWVVSPAHEAYRFESDAGELELKGSLEQILKEWNKGQEDNTPARKPLLLTNQAREWKRKVEEHLWEAGVRHYQFVAKVGAVEPLKVENIEVVLGPLPENFRYVPPVKVSGAIETTHWPSHRVKDWMCGQGFEFDPRPYEDDHQTCAFTSENSVEIVFDGWEPSDRSRKGGRMYLKAFKYTGRRGHTMVMVWESSSSNQSQLYRPLGYSSLDEWEEFLKQGTPKAWNHWHHYNGLQLDRLLEVPLEESEVTPEGEAANAAAKAQFAAFMKSGGFE